MNSEELISQLVSQAGLTQEQGTAANDVFQNTFLAGNKSKELIVNQLVERVGVDKAQAETIYTVGVGILTSTGVMDKVKNIFK